MKVPDVFMVSGNVLSDEEPRRVPQSPPWLVFNALPSLPELSRAAQDQNDRPVAFGRRFLALLAAEIHQCS